MTAPDDVRKLITVVTPAYNEEACLEELARRLCSVFEENAGYRFEVIIVDNGSEDRTAEIARSIHERDSRFKIVQLARNFRADGGITAGLDYVTGDACVIMSADLQDPPELISAFIRRWEEGFENIYMEVTHRRGTGPIRRLNSRLFYLLAAKLTSNRIPQNASDFRLVDRRVYEVVRSMEERNRFVRGLFGWVGFRSTGVAAERPKRYGGDSKAHSLQVLDLAIKGILAHSYVPLKLISIFGMILSFLSLFALIPLAVFWVVSGVPFAGFGSVVALLLVLLSLVALMLGIISEYVGLIYEESKRRPNFVVRSTLGFGSDQEGTGREKD